MKSLFSFEGRISRSKFWLLSITGIVLPTVLIIVTVAIFGLASFGASLSAGAVGSPSGAGTSIFIAIVVGVSLIAGLVISWSAAIRRFHDRGKSGWWSLIFLIPYIGGIWILVECGCLKGTDGPNQYGEDQLTLQDTSSPVVAPVQQAA